MTLQNSAAFYGWRVVGASFVLAVFGWGIGFYGPPIFLSAVRAARGWSLTLVSMAVSVHFLVGALTVANLPKLYRQFGVPTVTKMAAVSLAAGIIGWSLALEPWQLFIATIFSGAGWVAMSAAAINAILAPWFIRKRAAALSTAYNGASVGGIIFSPLWVAAIAFAGFPLATTIVGEVMIVTVWALADFIFSKTPQQMGVIPDGDAHGDPVTTLAAPWAKSLPGAQLWKDFRFVTLAAGMALGLFAQIGVVAHLFTLLTPALGAQAAGLAMGGATVAAVAGRTLVGWLMPAHIDRRLVASANYALQTFCYGAFILAHGTNIPLLLIGVFLFGFGIGNATSLPPLIAQVEFTKEDAPRVVALIVAIAQATYAFAPAIFGYVRDITTTANSEPGTAPYMFACAAFVELIALGAYLTGWRRVT